MNRGKTRLKDVRRDNGLVLLDITLNVIYLVKRETSYKYQKVIAMIVI